MNSILKLISTEGLPIESLNGQVTIAEAKDVFKSYIDSDFRNWKLDNAGQETPETKVAVYEMTKDATFSRMFGSLADDIDKLVMTQNQIIRFCEKHPSWLRQDGYATFFLIKEDGKYFVVFVRVNDGGLRVDVLRLECGRVWHAEYRPRVVAPQLMS